MLTHKADTFALRAVDRNEAATVLFIPGSLSSGRMWTPYAQLLKASRPVHTVDLIGYGASMAPPAGTRLRLTDEAAEVRRGLGEGDEAVHVVAHSYGGAIALRLALEYPARVASLTLVEPSCFQVLPDLGPPAAAADREIRNVADTVTQCVELGMPGAAAARFIDYWNGRGSWRALAPAQRDVVRTKIAKVPLDFAAIFAEPISLAGYRRVAAPALIVCGTRSPAPARLVAQGLARALVRGSITTVEGAGHMLPITHGPVLTKILRERFGVPATGWSLAG